MSDQKVIGIVRRLTSLEVNSSFDWAMKDLQSFEECHALQLTVTVLRALGLEVFSKKTKSGCGGEVAHWTRDELLLFSGKFSSMKEWKKISPGTYYCIPHLHEEVRKGIREKYATSKTMWCQLKPEEILSIANANKDKIYDSLPHGLRVHLLKPSQRELQTLVKGIMTKAGPKGHGQKLTAEIIIQRVLKYEIKSLRDAHKKDRPIYSAFRRNTKAAKAAKQFLLENGHWKEFDEPRKFKDPREVGDFLIEAFLESGATEFRSVQEINYPASRWCLRQELYGLVTAYVRLNLGHLKTGEFSKIYYWSGEEFERFIDVFKLSTQELKKLGLDKLMSGKGLGF